MDLKEMIILRILMKSKERLDKMDLDELMETEQLEELLEMLEIENSMKRDGSSYS